MGARHDLNCINGSLTALTVPGAFPELGRKEAQALYNRLWGSGFLPSKHQAVSLRSKGDPVLFLSNPAGVSPQVRRRMLDSLARLNQKPLDAIGDPETQARIAQYEMAFRMQKSVPQLIDISNGLH